MRFTESVMVLLAIAFGADACAEYRNCKCHDSNTGLQNDVVTQAACKALPGNVYYPEDNHSCEANKEDPYASGINNCDWNDACQQSGTQYYQVCWNKY